MARLAQRYGGDNVNDVTRCMRLPGFRNKKAGRDDAAVTWTDYGGRPRPAGSSFLTFLRPRRRPAIRGSPLEDLAGSGRDLFRKANGTGPLSAIAYAGATIPPPSRPSWRPPGRTRPSPATTPRGPSGRLSPGCRGPGGAADALSQPRGHAQLPKRRRPRSCASGRDTASGHPDPYAAASQYTPRRGG